MTRRRTLASVPIPEPTRLNKLRELAAMPAWPPVMQENLAAAYLSLSPSLFRSDVAPEVPVVHLTRRRVGWLRSDLDKWLARQAGEQASSPVSNPWHTD